MRGQHTGSPLAISSLSTQKWQGKGGPGERPRLREGNEGRDHRAEGQPHSSAQPLCPALTLLSAVCRGATPPRHPGGFPTVDFVYSYHPSHPDTHTHTNAKPILSASCVINKTPFPANPPIISMWNENTFPQNEENGGIGIIKPYHLIS